LPDRTARAQAAGGIDLGAAAGGPVEERFELAAGELRVPGRWHAELLHRRDHAVDDARAGVASDEIAVIQEAEGRAEVGLLTVTLAALVLDNGCDSTAEGRGGRLAVAWYTAVG
jgi:hypothetical protein